MDEVMEEMADQVVDKYEGRIYETIGRLKLKFEDAGMYASDTCDLWSDGPMWEFFVSREDPNDGGDIDDSIDVTIAFTLSDEGVAPSLSAVHAIGRLVADFTPFNYTGDVWVDPDDEEAMAERMDLFFNTILRDLRSDDPKKDGIVNLVTKHLKEEDKRV